MIGQVAGFFLLVTVVAVPTFLLYRRDEKKRSQIIEVFPPVVSLDERRAR